MGKTREPQSSNLPLYESQPADTKLKTKKKKKQSESNTGTRVGESPVDYNQSNSEQKTIQSIELQESPSLSLSELLKPEQVSSEPLKNIKSVSEPISDSPSESLKSDIKSTSEPISDSPDRLLEFDKVNGEPLVRSSRESFKSDIKSNAELISDSPDQLIESDKVNSEPVSNSPGESVEPVVVPSKLNSSSPNKLSLVEENNHPKTPTVNSELGDEPLSSSPEIKENPNLDTIPHSLSGAALARRLDVSPSTLRHKKNARNFGKWTLGHDPDGIAWHYDGKKFIPMT